MNNVGYIKLWRQIEASSLYFSEPFTRAQAWIDLLILARYTPGTMMIRGIPVHLKSGQLPAGTDFLSNRWKWSRGKVVRFLNYLEKTEQQIEQQKNNVCSIVSIVNWGLYQSNEQQTEQQVIQQTDSRRTADGHTKEGKERKEGKEVKRFTPPNLEEVVRYCQERNSPVDPQAFFDKGESNGWVDKNGNRYKDWKAVVRTWEKFSNKTTKQSKTGGIDDWLKKANNG